jgi:acyl-CoA reductase-like NAD-dependent aldehyde dehydrogenase
MDYRLLINGELVDGQRREPVINPATGEPFATYPVASRAQLDEAVAAAKRAFPAWSALSFAERRKIMHAAADKLAEHANDLARLVTLESGKTLAFAHFEVGEHTVGLFRGMADVEIPARILEDSDRRRIEVQRRPLGVVAAIIPWNFPASSVSVKLAPALITGNTVVLKPAPTTPLSALRIGELIADIFPPGVVNVIADANDLGDALTGHPDIAKITFTGSTRTGKRVYGRAAETMKRLTLELGGNDAAIVLDDADPVAMAPAIFKSAFVNSGQACVATKRLYVHESVHDDLCEALGRIADATVVGDGLDPRTEMGPLQNKVQFEKVQAYLAEARTRGIIVAGGVVLDRPGYFVRPTIVRNIAEDARLVTEEQFGPILPVIKYADLDDAIRLANDTTFGLGATVWSSNLERAAAVAARLEAGLIWINHHLDVTYAMPYGGAKHSGIGMELGGEEGLAEFTQFHVVNLAR